MRTIDRCRRIARLISGINCHIMTKLVKINDNEYKSQCKYCTAEFKILKNVIVKGGPGINTTVSGANPKDTSIIKSVRQSLLLKDKYKCYFNNSDNKTGIIFGSSLLNQCSRPWR